MSDLISRQAAIDVADKYLDADGCNGSDIAMDILGDLMNLPSAEPQERKGKWIAKEDLKQFFCDQCGEPSLTYDDIYIYGMDFPNFCPNCGADMRGEQNEP